MAANRTLPAVLAVATLTLAAVGEALVLAHAAGALGLILLACAAPAGIAAWVALGSPRTRADQRA